MMDLVKSTRESNPEEILISREDVGALERNLLGNLSELEKKVLTLYLGGKSYQEIGEILDRPVKSIDNALQRIKTKLEKHLRK